MTMKLYVANVTRQNQEVQFRVPERKSPVIVKLRPGSQTKVPGDLNSISIDQIVKQGYRYGWATADEATAGKRVVTIVFSADKPVTGVRLMAAMDANMRVLKKKGKEIRDLAAVAMSAELEQATAAAALTMREADVSIVEQDSPNRDTEHEMISEGRVVSRDAPPVSEPTSSNRRDRKKKN